MFFFDLDGTLVDSNGIWKQVDKDFLARRGLPYSREYYEGVAHTALPLAAEFTKEYCKLQESCEEIIAEWMEMSRDMYSRVPLKPGVRAYLKQCKAEGRRMAVVTSMPSRLPWVGLVSVMPACAKMSPILPTPMVSSPASLRRSSMVP